VFAETHYGFAAPHFSTVRHFYKRPTRDCTVITALQREIRSGITAMTITMLAFHYEMLPTYVAPACIARIIIISFVWHHIIIIIIMFVY